MKYALLLKPSGLKASLCKVKAVKKQGCKDERELTGTTWSLFALVNIKAGARVKALRERTEIIILYENDHSVSKQQSQAFPVNGYYHATAVLCESECGSLFSHFTAGWFSLRYDNGQRSNKSFPGYQKVPQSICFIAAIVCVCEQQTSKYDTELHLDISAMCAVCRRRACFYCNGLLQSSRSSLCINALWTVNSLTHEWTV